MSLAQEELKNWQRDVEAAMDEVKRATIPMQRRSAECTVRCFDSSDLTEIERCGQRCAQPLQEYQQRAQRFTRGLDESVQGCIKQCYDRVNPRAELLGPGKAGSPEFKALEQEVDQGAMKCLKDARPMLKDTKLAMLKDITACNSKI